MKKLTQYFLQGVLLVAPVVIIIYILYSMFTLLDGWLTNNMEAVVGFKIPGLEFWFHLFLSLCLGSLGKQHLFVR
jgi:uncharacterized membrane protein